jgi:hypothetical protein
MANVEGYEPGFSPRLDESALVADTHLEGCVCEKEQTAAWWNARGAFSAAWRDFKIMFVVYAGSTLRKFGRKKGSQKNCGVIWVVTEYSGSSISIEV